MGVQKRIGVSEYLYVDPEEGWVVFDTRQLDGFTEARHALQEVESLGAYEVRQSFGIRVIRQ